MMKRILYCAAVFTGLFWSCATPTGRADAFYFNGKIWTGDPNQPWATCMALKGNTLLYVGNDSAPYSNPQIRQIDLKGKLVVPGFIDNHTHFLLGGFELNAVNFHSAKSPVDFIHTLQTYCAQYDDDRWILGGLWDHESWGGALPETSWIDSICGNHPVFVSRYDGHMAFANSKALQMAGVTAATPDPPGGTIVRNKKGEPTGVVKDEAMSLIQSVIPSPTDKELDERFHRAQEHALEHGITQVHDMGGYGGWRDLDTYRRNERNKQLKMRIYAFMPLSTWAKLDSFCRENGKGDDQLRWGGLKGFVDGSLGSTTAWFYQPYLDAPNNYGLTINDTTAIREEILLADKAGMQVTVHAIGDRANDYLLQSYEIAVKENGERDRRFRIEHAQHLSPQALTRFASQHVIPSMHPYHTIDDGRWASKRLDADRLSRSYAFGTLLKSGATLTFGSDWTVAPLDALQGIYAAVTRRTLDDRHPQGWFPEQKLTVEQALRCYTTNNAYAGFQEKKLGMLRKGFLADFVVLSHDLFEIPPENIREAYVLRTVVDGKEVYQK
jgi:predicted amidohydrolase YtcJ